MFKQSARWLLHSLILFLVFCTPACKDSIVIEPPPQFPETHVTPMPVPATPKPSPETPMEIFQDKLDEGKEKLIYVPPILALLGFLLVVYQLFRVIHDLTTTSP